MRKRRFTGEQIIGFLKQVTAGTSAKDICRQGAFNDATCCRWRARFDGGEASEAPRLRELEAENARLKKLRAEAHRDLETLKVGFKAKPGLARKTCSGCQDDRATLVRSSRNSMAATGQGRTEFRCPWLTLHLQRRG